MDNPEFPVQTAWLPTRSHSDYLGWYLTSYMLLTC